MLWMSIGAVSGGAVLGSLLRWLLSMQFNALWPNLPLGTLLANLIGGYLVGVAVAVFAAYPALAPELRLLIITGFLGGLTTFSSFSAEVIIMLRDGRLTWALATVVAHLFGSLCMTLLGMATVALLRPPH